MFLVTSTRVSKCLNSAAKVSREIQQAFTHNSHEGIGFKHLLTVAACDIVFEYQRSIVLLIFQSHSGSALALLRVTHEAKNRAYWLHLCVTEEKAIAIAKHKEQIPRREM